jgi:hypothetical protein
MSWDPNLSDVPQPIPFQKLLRKAVQKLYIKQVIMNPSEVLKDSYGVWGFRYPKFLLVAKDKNYGNIISVHQEAVLKARLYNIHIVIWLDCANKFYQLDPLEIDRNSEKNYKGHTAMLNFDIKYAKPIEGW